MQKVRLLQDKLFIKTPILTVLSWSFQTFRLHFERFGDYVYTYFCYSLCVSI